MKNKVVDSQNKVADWGNKVVDQCFSSSSINPNILRLMSTLGRHAAYLLTSTLSGKQQEALAQRSSASCYRCLRYPQQLILFISVFFRREEITYYRAQDQNE